MLALRKLFSTIAGMREVLMIRSRILFVYHVDTQPPSNVTTFLLNMMCSPR